jgi:hypothetical protein
LHALITAHITQEWERSAPDVSHSADDPLERLRVKIIQGQQGSTAGKGTR